jgi:acyl-CoA reductase-like NAD-dependent aldehyde dehydrogenase
MAGTDTRQIEVRSPFDGSVVGTVPAQTAEDVDAACRRAAAALERGWPQHERIRALEVAAELVRERNEELARTIALEAGKPIRTARVEAARCVDTLCIAAAEGRRLGGEVIPMGATASGAGRVGFALRVPIGVVAAISPFNFPLNLVAHKLAPAIAAGCPVVLKPASATPLSAHALVAILVEAGMPEDWVTVVTGSGGEVGDALVMHEVPRLVTFTGSAPVGWGIVARAPRKKVKLELGSTSPLIVEADAELGAVAAKVRVGGFSHAGQSCISTQRIYVQRPAYAPFLEALRQEVEAIVVGDPLDEATEVGPLITEGERDRVVDWIEEARAGGGEVVAGGEVVDGVLRPTVIGSPPADAKVCRQEVFGPVVVVQPYDDFDEALRLANDSEFGLQAGVFTNDLAKAMKAARTLEFGGVIVNDLPTVRVDQQPYGGVRESGNTREGPAYAIQEMTELRFVSLPG